jgi:hypothetical protein
MVNSMRHFYDVESSGALATTSGAQGMNLRLIWQSDGAVAAFEIAGIFFVASPRIIRISCDCGSAPESISDPIS